MFALAGRRLTGNVGQRKMSPFSLLRLPLMAAIAVAVGGCTTTSKRVLFQSEDFMVTQTETHDHGLQMTGHGGSVLVTNSASVFGKRYSVLAGREPCVFSVRDRQLLFFVCLAQKPDGTITPDRELHIVDLGMRSDTTIFLGRSRIGDDFGQHKAGSQFSERVEFVGDRLLQITTFDEVGDWPSTKRVFVVDQIEKKLVSETNEPMTKKKEPNPTSEPTAPSGRGSP